MPIGERHPGAVRVILELARDGSRVEGTVAAEGSNEPLAFFGWLDLLRLLERVPAQPEEGKGCLLT